LNTLLDKETGFSSLCAKKITSENHFHEMKIIALSWKGPKTESPLRLETQK
jgi:hypothetical protein